MRHRQILTSIFSAHLVLAPGAALAQEADSDPETQNGIEIDAAIGPGIFIAPKYPGAKDYLVLPLPALDLTAGRFFLNRDGLGINVVDVDGLTIGLSGFVEFGRDENDDPVRLRGLGDLDAVPQGKLFVSKQFGRMMARATLKHAFGATDGTTLDLEAGMAFPLSSGVIFAGPIVSFADAKYADGFFGISADQAVAGQRPAYDPDPGLYQVGINAGANFPISDRWSAGAFASYRYLVGDAGKSPVIADRDQPAAGLFLSYRF
jgi:MipA family protein